MNTETVRDQIKDVVVERLCVHREDVVDTALFTDNLGADSLDQVELVMALEEKFDCQISNEDAEKLQTVGDAVEYITAHIAQSDPGV
jgi:acyl carrier protein